MKRSRMNPQVNLKAWTVILVLLVVCVVANLIPELKPHQNTIYGVSALLIVASLVLMIVDVIRKARNRLHTRKLGKKLENNPNEVKPDKAASIPEFKSNHQFATSSVVSGNDIYVDCGLYEPIYKFMDAAQYSDKLKSIRQRQKQMIREKIACSFPRDMTYNGSKQQGAALVNDWIRLMLRAFNGECEAIILKARFDNVNALAQRIQKSADAINAIGKRMNVQITQSYIDLKIDELHVAFEYEQFKQDEKERLRQIREEEREKAEVEKELKEKLSKLDKDIKHITNEKQALQARIDAAGEDDDVTSLQYELDKLISREDELNREKEDVEEREVNARAGYVYIISNIGSFGENVYKIGMTRRLDPQERVDELGSASVPFLFDVHAFIFSTDAVALETALHHRFDRQRINLVNPRKEFFAVTLDEIEAEVKRNFNGTVEFHRTAIAEQYRESLAIREREMAS